MEKRIKYEPGKPVIAQSKMGEVTVSEFEVGGIEGLTPVEKKHLLLQLSRDRVKDSSSGPWEIVDVLREEWRTVKATLVQPIELEIRDTGKDELFRVWFDITKLERDLEAATLNNNLDQ
ncbi:hypothetical protein ACSAZL_06240 [Methanosarcina sp. T3]|uniref:hypothetical protein n=1 Tax=Methanosarcina sp. T3 TaxID=3439062 RepID=UPI003F8459E6